MYLFLCFFFCASFFVLLFFSCIFASSHSDNRQISLLIPIAFVYIISLDTLLIHNIVLHISHVQNRAGWETCAYCLGFFLFNEESVALGWLDWVFALRPALLEELIIMFWGVQYSVFMQVIQGLMNQRFIRYLMSTLQPVSTQ
ncbi:hypothetical protein EV426DRAFT_219241 [Tirmania nivea]|nr:hypothetical protein EV426DRAFT_219241 [Tirmania nivea]